MNKFTKKSGKRGGMYIFWELSYRRIIQQGVETKISCLELMKVCLREKERVWGIEKDKKQKELLKRKKRLNIYKKLKKDSKIKS